MDKGTHHVVWWNKNQEQHSFDYTGTQVEALNHARNFLHNGFDYAYVTGYDELGKPYYLNVVK